MSKKLVVYYSYEGSTKQIAEKMASSINADILRLKPKDEKKRQGLGKYFWNGMKVVMKNKPELEELAVNLADYDTLIIGTPVWASNFTPPIRTFIESNNLRDKDVALFCTYLGNAGKTITEFKKLCKYRNFIGEFEFVRPMDNIDKALTDAENWIKTL